MLTLSTSGARLIQAAARDAVDVEGDRDAHVEEIFHGSVPVG
jgi:hypothetical protein